MRHRLNQEAAEVITRQIRLRNLSGMIVIDFLHGMNRSEREAITRSIEKGIKHANLITTVYGFTAMGLFELSRERSEATFKEQYESAKRRYHERVKEKIKEDKKL